MKAAKNTNETYAAKTLRTSFVSSRGQVMANRSGFVGDWLQVDQLLEVPQSPCRIGHRPDTAIAAAQRPCFR